MILKINKNNEKEKAWYTAHNITYLLQNPKSGGIPIKEKKNRNKKIPSNFVA
jgi:hypothetical protein